MDQSPTPDDRTNLPKILSATVNGKSCICIQDPNSDQNLIFDQCFFRLLRPLSVQKLVEGVLVEGPFQEKLFALGYVELEISVGGKTQILEFKVVSHPALILNNGYDVVLGNSSSAKPNQLNQCCFCGSQDHKSAVHHRLKTECKNRSKMEQLKMEVAKLRDNLETSSTGLYKLE